MHPSRTGACALLIVGVLLLAGPAAAREIYVSPTGSDLRSGSAPRSALRTLAAATSRAGPGDTVVLLPGRYHEPLRPVRSGEAGRPIVFRSHGPQPAVLTHARTNGLRAAILVEGRSHIVIDGVHVDGVRPGPHAHVRHFAVIRDSRHVVLRRMHFRYANGYQGMHVRGRSEFVTLEDSVLDFVGEYHAKGRRSTDWGDLLEITRESRRVLIQRNTFRHGPHNLISARGSELVIQDNYFDNSFRDVLGGEAGGRIGTLQGARSVFQRNFVTGSGASSDKDFNGMLKVEGTANIARHNLFVHGQHEGIITEAGSWSRTSTFGRIYHNTFYGLGSGAWRVRHYSSGDAIGEYVFKNNLVVESRLKPLRSRLDADVIFQVHEAGIGPTARSRVVNNLLSPGERKAATFKLDGFRRDSTTRLFLNTYSPMASPEL
jgi:hypothetical protein